MKKDNVIPVNQNFQNISDIFVLICELIAAKIFGDKVSKKYDKTFQVLLIIPIISIFILHNLFTLGIHRRPLMLSFEERGCHLIDSPFLIRLFYCPDALHDQPYASVNPQKGAVQHDMVVGGSAPGLTGVTLMMKSPFTVLLLHDGVCFFGRDFILGLDALPPLVRIRADKDAQAAGIIF